ncbi:MAG: amidohydrolase family protein [Deltaproteobacteria bacterium]|nr:amidohydrolase family protein [Deltaproteobacteria bacterium]MDZ4341608.1 amidohydrolase family protein [Candidatus Binatia bacterium]
MTVNAGEDRRIDVHHHVVPPQYAGDSMPIKLPDTATQLRTMDGWRIQTAITSLTPRVLMANSHRLREVARTCNEFQARMLGDHPSRFGAFALLPLPDVEGALRELAYALDVLRLDGIGLFSSYDGRYLGDPSFDPVFDELHRRKAIVFIHPTHCEAPAETNLGAPPFVVEYVFDTTRAIVNLIFTGTLKRCPDIRVIVAHGGGAAPFLAQRISMLEGHRHARTVTDVIPTLRSLYYEIASTTAPYALRSLQELVGATRILWGSDLPFVYGERLKAEVYHWQDYDGFDDDARTAVERENALGLLPRFAAAADDLSAQR